MDAEAQDALRHAPVEDRLTQLRTLWDKRRRGEPFKRLHYLGLRPGDVLLVHETESPWMAEDWLGMVTDGSDHYGWFVEPCFEHQWRVKPSAHYMSGGHGTFPNARGVYLTRSDTAIKL